MPKAHPYLGQPDYQFWRNDPGIAEPHRFDPVTSTSFLIQPADPIVTAGSCFAQHVARHLSRSGFNFLVTEPAHPFFPLEVAERFNYGLFSARYGNIYTARQLKQLLQRAYGGFEPMALAWAARNGTWVDPFRPQIQPGGFSSPREIEEDRLRHFAAIREAVETMSVFVFTLGLTEGWMDRRDGAVFPLAPGVAGGVYDPDEHGFVNFSVSEIEADLRWSLDFIRDRNPDVRFLITVSPVPLNATALDRHVAVATAYSKAVLRVAAETICAVFANCDYFPSYEIITSPQTRGLYFGPDRREVTEAGVNHVMSNFLRHYTAGVGRAPALIPVKTEDGFEAMSQVVEVLCDEESISNVAMDSRSARGAA